MKNYPVISSAKESYGEEFNKMPDNEAEKGNWFKTVKCIIRQKLKQQYEERQKIISVL